MNNKKPDIIIAIDPDVESNGVARLDLSPALVLQLTTYPFPELIDYLRYVKRGADVSEKTMRVVIEAGWLNRSNWHVYSRDTKAVAAAKGTAAGRNHETGRKIAEMCRYHAIPYELIKPLRKIWKGEERKISAQEFKAVTGYTARTNQEMRDAGLIAWVYANLPIKL